MIFFLGGVYLDHQRSALRVGLAAIACALVFRLFALGLPGKVAALLKEPNIAAFLTYLETGRDVRFSPSLEAFSPDFVESPPAATQAPIQSALPVFSDGQVAELYNVSGKDPDLPGLLTQPLTWDLRGEGPTVLILHTHTTESYTKAGESYPETADWRTLEEDYNMLSIGQQVATLLEEEGIQVIQDRQLHDYPSYNGSYADARASLRELLAQYPTVRLVLDLHRDAVEVNGSQLRTLAQVDGQDSAQLMVVLGAGHDGYEENLALALKLYAQLELLFPGITRPLQLRTGRFNQDLCPGALLVEVGAAGNTHAEAMRAAQALSEAIVTLAGGTGPAQEGGE